MRRREFISLVGGVAATWPIAVHAQQPPPVVGLLRNTEGAEWIAAFRRGLSDSGYTDGTNVTVDIRVAEGKRDRLSELAADLVRKRVAAIVVNTNAAPFAIAATKSIPIVFVTGSDPIATGFVQNLNHPGGNVTGVSFFNEPLGSKRLEILHELVPKAETVALLVDPDYFRGDAELRELKMGGQALGEKVVVFKASNDPEIDAAFTAIAQAKVSAMLVGGCILNKSTPPDSWLGGAPQDSRNLRHAPTYRGRWADELWCQYHGCISPCRRLCRSHTERRQAGRSSG
jgi:putative tryptophan/tyrosine transport system substrate-binding protein